MVAFIEWLKGKKTFFVGAAMVVLSGLFQQGYIDQAVYDWLMGLLLGGGFVTMKLGQLRHFKALMDEIKKGG